MGEDINEDILLVGEVFSLLCQLYKKWGKFFIKVIIDYLIMQCFIIRGFNDLCVLLMDVGFGVFLVVGLFWFGVLFGRDSLIVVF